MKLKEFMEVIDPNIEFELFLENRIGVFQKGDIGLEKYLEDIINDVSIDASNKRITIALD